jgi:hypothetical protein
MSGSLVVLIVIIVFAVIIAALRPGRKGKAEAVDGGDEGEALILDMDASFLNVAQKTGKRVVDAVVVHASADLALLRSLLYSGGIENYVRNDHVSALLPGVGINGLTSMVISVFEDDYEATCEIVGEYLDEKMKGREEGNRGAGDKIRNVGEFVVTGRFVSSGDDSMDPRVIPLPGIKPR